MHEPRGRRCVRTLEVRRRDEWQKWPGSIRGRVRERHGRHESESSMDIKGSECAMGRQKLKWHHGKSQATDNLINNTVVFCIRHIAASPRLVYGSFWY